jgi:hypothetical protein
MGNRSWFNTCDDLADSGSVDSAVDFQAEVDWLADGFWSWVDAAGLTPEAVQQDVRNTVAQFTAAAPTKHDHSVVEFFIDYLRDDNNV